MIYIRYKKHPGSQVKTPKFLIPASNIVKNLESYMRDLSHAQRELLKYFFWMDLHHDVIYSSQQHIATQLGVGRQYVNKMIKRFCEDGIIGKQYRHLKTCVYKVSPFFRSRSTRDRLSGIFSIFKRSYLWVLSLQERQRTQQATQVLNTYINRDRDCMKNSFSKIESLERYKKRMEYERKNKSSNDFYKSQWNYTKRTDGELNFQSNKLSHVAIEPPISSYQLMLQQQDQESVIPERKIIDSSKENLLKLHNAAQNATGFAKKLLTKYMPKFLVGEDGE